MDILYRGDDEQKLDTLCQVKISDKLLSMKIIKGVEDKEIEVLRKLRERGKKESNIVQLIYTFVKDEGNGQMKPLALLTEITDTGSFKEIVSRQRKIPEHIMLGYMHEAMNGLYTIHWKDVAYKGLKPEVFRFAKDSEQNKEVVKISNFGLADLDKRAKSSM